MDVVEAIVNLIDSMAEYGKLWSTLKSCAIFGFNQFPPHSSPFSSHDNRNIHVQRNQISEAWFIMAT